MPRSPIAVSRSRRSRRRRCSRGRSAAEKRNGYSITPISRLSDRRTRPRRRQGPAPWSPRRARHERAARVARSRRSARPCGRARRSMSSQDEPFRVGVAEGDALEPDPWPGGIGAPASDALGLVEHVEDALAVARCACRSASEAADGTISIARSRLKRKNWPRERARDDEATGGEQDRGLRRSSAGTKQRSARSTRTVASKTDPDASSNSSDAALLRERPLHQRAHQRSTPRRPSRPPRVAAGRRARSDRDSGTRGPGSA